MQTLKKSTSNHAIRVENEVMQLSKKKSAVHKGRTYVKSYILYVIIMWIV
jgi:hypothetical protein